MKTEHGLEHLSCNSFADWVRQEGCVPYQAAVVLAAVLAFSGGITSTKAQPAVVDPELAVRTVVTNLGQPVGMAFLGRTTSS